MKKEILVLICALLTLNLASAAFELQPNSTSIENSYFGGEFVRGKIRMNFLSHENKLFTSNFNGSISLYDLFKKMNYTAFLCEPANCKDSYKVEGEGMRDLNIDLGVNKKVYGFKLAGIIGNIEGFAFNLSSDASPSCAPPGQFEIDLLDDGKIDFYNTKNSGQACGSPNYGCFSGEDSSQTVILGNEFYCQMIYNLSAAPAYKIGANLVEDFSLGNLELYFYNSSGKFLGASEIRNARPTVAGTIINFSSTDVFNAFVCIRKKGDAGNYKIRAENINACGWRGTQSIPSSFSTDYELFAQPMQYASIGTIKFDDRTDIKLRDSIKNYIRQTYNNICPADGCTIPLSLKGNVGSQSLSISSILIRYQYQSGITETRDIYQTSKKAFTISSNNTPLDIEKMEFEVPNLEGNQTFLLYFDRENNSPILEKQITVKPAFGFNIVPRFAFVGRETDFIASAENRINSSIWNFGDGSALVNSQNNIASHKYNLDGEYTTEVTITDSLGNPSKKKFKILVGNAKVSANITVTEYKSRLKNIDADTLAYQEWIKNKIKEKLNYNSKKSTIDGIIARYNLLGENSSDTQYIQIINELLAVELPDLVETTKSGKLPGDLGFNNINVRHIESISREDAGDSELKSAIIKWMSQSYNIEIEFYEISGISKEETKGILTAYKVNLIKKDSGEGTKYLIINRPKNSLFFKANYNADAISGEATYIPVTSALNTIEFLTDENIPIENLGIYISPLISELGPLRPIEDEVVRKELVFSWAKFLISLVVLLAITFIVYIILQTWYKKHYERHLFKNPDDLYNIINFIYNSRKISLEDSEIKGKLKKSNWSGEQITYAFKKIDGKRIGMWEIPIFKYRENKKVKEEIQKRQQRLDTGFIKKPALYI